MVKKHCIGGLVARPMLETMPLAPEVGGSTPMDYHKLLYTGGVPRGSPRLGHVAPYHLPPKMTCVSTLLVHVPCQITCPVSLPTQHLCTVASPCHLPRVGPYHATSTLYGLYSQQNFACLEKWTEHDISLIRRLFEPIQVALGS
jgi:hypothetical protein